MDEYLGTELNTLIKSIRDITDLPEDSLDSDSFNTIKEMIKANFTNEMKEQSVNQLVHNLDDQRLTREEAIAAINAVKDLINELIFNGRTYSEKKIELIHELVDPMYESFDEAIKRYHLYDIELPMTVADGATVPTYAHDSDAAADLYALETVKLGPNTQGNKIRTGINIQLPEGWLALIIPRSSMGAKTPLRLSNSCGLIDSGYRGELGILYDNISDGPYTINAGDRIAQLLVMPSYRFKPQVVESLETSDRGTGGFGSSGK